MTAPVPLDGGIEPRYDPMVTAVLLLLPYVEGTVSIVVPIVSDWLDNDESFRSPVAFCSDCVTDSATREETRVWLSSA